MKRRELLVWTLALPVVLKANGAQANPFMVEGRTYDAPVLILDGTPDTQGDVFDRSTTLVFSSSLPIYFENLAAEPSPSSYAGMASMRLDKYGGKRVLSAYVNLNTAPEAVRAALPLMYPSVAGVVSERKANVIKHAEITRIMLHTGKNSDARIKRLGEAQ